MGFRINTNVPSIQAQSSLRKVNKAQSENFEKLSSGSRINKSSDDAAGLAISEKMKANISSLRQADRNANDGVSMLQVAEGGLTEQSNILVRLRELAVQSASDTIGDKERGYTDLEYQQLKQEMQRISDSTEFNGNKLLDGSGDALEFQVGIQNNEDLDRIVYDAGETAAGLSDLDIEDISVADKESAQDSLEGIDEAISKISGQRANLGALANRLQTTSRNLNTSIENQSAANSRIRDVDYASATAEQARNTVIQQAATAVLGQSNSSSQIALRLVG